MCGEAAARDVDVGCTGYCQRTSVRWALGCASERKCECESEECGALSERGVAGTLGLAQAQRDERQDKSD